MQHFVPKGFSTPLADALTLVGKHLHGDDWNGEETTAAAMNFCPARFQVEVDDNMVGWLRNRMNEIRGADWWLEAGRRLNIEGTPKGAGRYHAGLGGPEADAEWSVATAMLCELRHHRHIRDLNGHLKRIVEERTQGSDIPKPAEEGTTASLWDLSSDDLEAMDAAETEYREFYRPIIEAHERFGDAAGSLQQALCGTPPGHDDAVAIVVVSKDVAIDYPDPRLWASPNAVDLIKTAIEAGDRALRTTLGTRDIRGHVFVHHDSLLADFDLAGAIDDDKQEAGARGGEDRQIEADLAETPSDDGEAQSATDANGEGASKRPPRRRDPSEDVALRKRIKAVLDKARSKWPIPEKRPSAETMATVLVREHGKHLEYGWESVRKILAGNYEPARNLDIGPLS